MATEMSAINKSEAIDEAINEFRKPWVDNPDASFFSSHRNLTRCERDLKVMVLALKEYACNEEENDLEELEAVYDYILNARSVYVKALHSWIESANEALKEGSVPALPRVQKLLSDYGSSAVHNKIDKYFSTAKLSPHERSAPSEVSSLSSRSSTTSKFSRASQEVISRMVEEHNQQMSQIKDRLIDAEITAEQQEKKAYRERQRAEEESAKADRERQRAEEESAKADRERQRAEEESAKADRERQRAEEESAKADQERRRAEEERIRFAERESSLRSERDTLLRKKDEEILDQEKMLETQLGEKGEMLKQKNRLESELLKYKKIAEEVMFPDAYSAEYMGVPQHSKLADARREISLSKAEDMTPTVSGIQLKAKATSHKTGAADQTMDGLRQYTTENKTINGTAGSSAVSRVLRTEAPEFIPRRMERLGNL